MKLSKHINIYADTVRLVGGSTEYEGRLEVYYNGAWGTVCESELNANISTVVCRTLGLPWLDYSQDLITDFMLYYPC